MSADQPTSARRGALVMGDGGRGQGWRGERRGTVDVLEMNDHFNSPFGGY